MAARTALPMRPSAPATAGAGADGCGYTLIGGALDMATAEHLARSFRALADPTRVRLLSLIAAADGGEACICDLTDPVSLSQPSVSHHMKQLVEAGLVTRDQRGKWAYYAVVTASLQALGAALGSPVAQPERPSPFA
jgi:ArsR family transcriptional regulator